MALQALRQIRNAFVATAIACFIGAFYAGDYLNHPPDRFSFPLSSYVVDGVVSSVEIDWLFVFLVRFLLGFGLSWLPLMVVAVISVRRERSAS